MRDALLCITYFLVTALTVIVVAGFYKGELRGGILLGATAIAVWRVAAFVEPFPFRERRLVKSASNKRIVVVGAIAAILDLVLIAVCLVFADWIWEHFEPYKERGYSVGDGFFFVALFVALFGSIAPIVLTRFGVQTRKGDTEDAGEDID